MYLSLLAFATPAPTPTEPTSALDPTAQVLLTIFGAALVTALAGFAGAALQGRRDHTRWLNEERLAAYVLYLQFMRRALEVLKDHEKAEGKVHELLGQVEKTRAAVESASDSDRPALQQDVDKQLEEITKLRDELLQLRERLGEIGTTAAEHYTAAQLLGPRSVSDLADRVTDAFGENSEEMSHRIQGVEAVMRRALGIKK